MSIHLWEQVLGSKHIYFIYAWHPPKRYLLDPIKWGEMQIWMFQKILRFLTFQTPSPLEKNVDLDVSGDFTIFNFLDPQKWDNADLDVTADFKIFNISDPLPPKKRKIQIWMFQKIVRFSTFWTPQNEKNADLYVSEDFKILNFSYPPKHRFGWFQNSPRPHLYRNIYVTECQVYDTYYSYHDLTALHIRH